MATAEAPTQIPEASIGRVEERELPQAPPLRRIVGPSVILVGVGIASGEYILFPYVASQVGLTFLWAAVVGLLTQFFINMEIERYTLASRTSGPRGPRAPPRSRRSCSAAATPTRSRSRSARWS